MTTRVRFVNRFPLEFGGGGETTAISVGNALASDFDLEYLSASNFQGWLRTDHQQVSSRIKFRYRRVPFHKLGCPLLAPLTRPVPAVAELADADVILFNVDRPVCPSYFSLLARRASVVLLLHGFTIELPRLGAWRANLVSGWTWMTGATMALGIRRLVESGVSFQVFNGHQLGYLQLLGVPREQIYLIDTGIDFGKYAVARNDEEFHVAFVGRIERLLKGIDYLVEAARTIRRTGTPIYFDILGSGPDARVIEQLASADGAVRYHGFVSEEEKVRTLQQANLSVSTSIIEPYSLAIVEALASGLPVVSTPASGPTGILSLDPTFGSVARRGSRSIAELVLQYYHQWIRDKEAYFQAKLRRRDEAAKSLDLGPCVAGYKQMIESAKGRGPVDLGPVAGRAITSTPR